MLKIWDLAKDKISDEDISEGFEWAANYEHTETVVKIWDLAKDKICNLQSTKLKEKTEKFFEDLSYCPDGGDSLLQGEYISKGFSKNVAYCNHYALNVDNSKEKEIPLTTHHIWLTNAEKPKELTEHMQAWAKKSAAVLSGNTNWQNIFWVNDKKLIPNTVKELEKVGYIFREVSELGQLTLNAEYSSALSGNKFGLASDILRYEILDKLGGLYFDTDYDLLADPSKLHTQVDFYTGIEPFGKFKAGNAIIGAKPNHPIIKGMLQHIKEWSDQTSAPKFLNQCSQFDQTIYITGPFGFTKAYLENSGKEGNIDIVIKPETVYSEEYKHNGGKNINPSDKFTDHLECDHYCTLKNANNEELVLGYHYWGNTWVKAEFGSCG